MLGNDQYGLILLEKWCWSLLRTRSDNPEKANRVLTARESNGIFLNTQTRMTYNHHVDGFSESAEIAKALRKKKTFPLHGVVKGALEFGSQTLQGLNSDLLLLAE